MLACLLTALMITSAIQLKPEVLYLTNGLKVVVVEDHRLPLASVQVWYRVGSGDDDLGRPGLCELTRTILEARAPTTVLRSPRWYFESRTLRDACYFAWLVPADAVNSVLRQEAERMRPLTTTAEMLEAAVAAVGAGAEAGGEDASVASQQRILAAAFPGHPYGHPPQLVVEASGAPCQSDEGQGVRAWSTESIDQFASRWFTPSNAVVVVIGDVQPPLVFERIREDFACLPWAQTPTRERHKPPEAEVVRLPPVEADRPGLMIAWVTGPGGALDDAALDVLMHRLCNPVDGCLYKRLLQVGGLPPRWQRQGWREASLLTLTVFLTGQRSVATDSPPQGPVGPQSERRAAASCEPDSLVIESLRLAASEAPTEIELDRARALAARQIRSRRSAFAEHALRLGWLEVVAGNLSHADWELPAVLSVSVRDLQRAATELLEARTVYLPLAARPQAAHTTAPIPPGLLPTASATPQATGDLAFIVGSCAAGEPAGLTGRLEAVGKLVTGELDNVVQVHIRVVDGLELTQVRTLLSSDRDSASAGAWPSDMLKAVHALMAVGSTRHSIEQLRDYLSYHGLDLFPEAAGGQAGLCSRGPPPLVPQMIELHAELLRHPDRSQAACCQAVREIRRVSQFASGESSVATVASSDVGHTDPEWYLPPGLLSWRPEMSTLVDADRLRDAVSRLDAIRRVQVWVVGDVDPEAVFQAVRLSWSDWSSRAEDPDGRSP